MDEIKVKSVGKAERLSLYLNKFYSRYSIRAMMQRAREFGFKNESHEEFLFIMSFLLMPIGLLLLEFLFVVHHLVFIDVYYNPSLGVLFTIVAFLPGIIIINAVLRELKEEYPHRNIIKRCWKLIKAPYNFAKGNDQTGGRILVLGGIAFLWLMLTGLFDSTIIPALEEYLIFEPALEYVEIDGSSDIVKYEYRVIDREITGTLFHVVSSLYAIAILSFFGLNLIRVIRRDFRNAMNNMRREES